MGTETLPSSTTVAAGLIVKSSDFLTTNAALQGALVGRNTSGVPTSGQSLGTALYPWGNVFTDVLTIDGSVVDVSGIVSPANRIVSGKTRTTSGQPLFIDPHGAANSFVLEGAVTDLVLSIDSTAVTVTTDITETGLTTAPGTNNTCAINDASFVDQSDSKYFGEIDSQKLTITIDAVGSEISSRVGQMIALKTDTSEIMWGWLRSATEFTDVKRGYFFDKDGAPIVRETLIDDEVLTLLETGWIFVENDALTLDVTYLTPVYSFTSPAGPATGQYWYDLANQTWKRYSGSAFVAINRTLVGLAVIDTSNCIGARAFDFYQGFEDTNTIGVEVFSDTIVRSTETENCVNVYGTKIQIPFSVIDWDNSADMETGSVAADTLYRLYMSTDGETFVSLERAYDRTGDLKGKYHPYNNWRYIADAKTDADSDWLTVLSASTFDSLTPLVRSQSENGVLGNITNTTIDYNADSLSCLNSENVPAWLFGIDDTFDITTDRIDGTGATNELVSTWYLCLKDSLGNRKMAPKLTGTADADVLNSLSDSTAAFQTHLSQRWDFIRQTTDNTEGYVKAVSSENVITCMDINGLDLDLFPDGDETYEIIPKSPPGLGSFKAVVCEVYNDSSSNLVDSRKNGQARITKSFWHTQNSYGTTNDKAQRFTTEVTASDQIVATITNLAGAAANDGFRITANMDCKVFLSWSANFVAAASFGFSKNSAELTTSIATITAATRLTMTQNGGAQEPETTAWSGVLKKGDFIVPHTDGGANGNTAQNNISVLAVEII